MMKNKKAAIKPRQANLETLHAAGTYATTEDSCARRLARAIHATESTDCCTSWSAQERAQAYFNQHGLARALDECARLEALRLIDADN